MTNKLHIDLTHGSIFKKMLLYALPLMATNILQVFFHSADVFVLGLCLDGDLGDLAMAAVGANGTLINFITGLFIGVSMGTNVLVAKYLGAKNQEKMQKNVGMAILFPLLAGAIIFLIGFFGARTFLTWLKVEENIMEMAVKYLQIYSIGFPLTLLYNFTSAVLRGVGDTVKPLIFLIISGVTNVCFNLIFVLLFGLDVEGVALATIISQGLSATLCIISLLKTKEMYRLKPKNIKIYPEELKEILRIGVPMGVQSMLFSIANLSIQSCINGFGEYATAGNSVASSIDNMLYHVIHAFALTLLTFSGQNYGAGNYDRIVNARKTAILLELTFGLLAGLIMLLLSKILVPVLASNSETIYYAQKRLTIMGLAYFMCGIMDCYSCSMRGVGRSFSSMIISLFGACVLRLVWIEILKMIPAIYTIEAIYITWPMSWIITIIIYIFVTKSVFKKVKAELQDNKESLENVIGE